MSECYNAQDIVKPAFQNMQTKRIFEKLVCALKKTCSVPLYKDQEVKYISGGSSCFPKNYTQSTLFKVTTGVSIKQLHLTEHKEIFYSQQCQISPPQDT